MKRKLLSAGIRLALGLIAVAIVSYWWFSDAWFAQSDKVQTNGVELSAMVPLTVYISGSQDERLSQQLTFSMADFEELGFSSLYDYGVNIVLRPSSSPNGKNFWFARKVQTDGSAITNPETGTKYAAVGQNDKKFCMGKTVYLVTTTEAHSDITALDCFVSKVAISGLTDNELYKAARISLSVTDDLGVETTYIYRYAADGTDTSGAALPVNGINTKSSTDPSYAMGIYESGQAGALPFKLICANSGTISVRELTIRIWFEGENNYAVRAHAGGGFAFELEFTLVDPA